MFDDDDLSGFITDLSGDTQPENDGGLFYDDGSGGDLSSDDMYSGTEPPAGTEGDESAADLSGAPEGGESSAPSDSPPAQPSSYQTPPTGGSQTQAQPGQQQTQQAQPQQPVDFEQYLRDNWQSIVINLADNVFQLTKEEVEAMGEGAAKHVPPLLARSHLMGMVQVARALQASLPATVANLVNVSLQSREWEHQFRSAYPALAQIPAQNVYALAQTLRRNNPQMSGEEFMPLLARTVAASHGVQLPPQRGNPRPPAPPAANRGAQPPRGQQNTQVASEPLSFIAQSIVSGAGEDD